MAVDPGANAGADRTRYLVEDAARETPFWVAETEIERTYPLLPGDAVIGYMTVQPGTRASRPARGGRPGCASRAGAPAGGSRASCATASATACSSAPG